MHVHEYVKQIVFEVKYQTSYYFIILLLCIWKSFKLFIMFKYHFKLTEISFVHCLFPW